MTIQTNPITCIAFSPYNGEGCSKLRNKIYVSISQRTNRPDVSKYVSGSSAARLAHWITSRADRGTYEFEITNLGDTWYRWWNVSEQPK